MDREREREREKVRGRGRKRDRGRERETERKREYFCVCAMCEFPTEVGSHLLHITRKLKKMRYYLHYIFLGFQFKYIWTNCIFSPPEIAQQRGFGAYVWVSLVYRSNRQNLGSTCVFSHSLKVTPHLFSDTELRGAITKKKEKISEYVPIRLPLPLSNPDYFQFQTFLKMGGPPPPPSTHPLRSNSDIFKFENKFMAE